MDGWSVSWLVERINKWASHCPPTYQPPSMMNGQQKTEIESDHSNSNETFRMVKCARTSSLVDCSDLWPVNGRNESVESQSWFKVTKFVDSKSRALKKTLWKKRKHERMLSVWTRRSGLFVDKPLAKWIAFNDTRGQVSKCLCILHADWFHSKVRQVWRVASTTILALVGNDNTHATTTCTSSSSITSAVIPWLQANQVRFHHRVVVNN